MTGNIACAAALPTSPPTALGGTTAAIEASPQALLLLVQPDPTNDCTVGLAIYDAGGAVWYPHEVAPISVPHGTAIVDQRYVDLGIAGYFAPYIASGTGVPVATRLEESVDH